MQPKISFGFLVHNESHELLQVLTQLSDHLLEHDEVVIVCDEGNTSEEVTHVIQSFQSKIKNLKVFYHPLNQDFAAQKNFMAQNCTGDWIFQIDADEYLDEGLLENLRPILISNSKVEMFRVPRINIVKGITQNHLLNWRWRINEKGWINFPDYQTRIFKNGKGIHWKNRVHESLTGYSITADLPQTEEFCIWHIKEISRQEQQNELYQKM